MARTARSTYRLVQQFDPERRAGNAYACRDIKGWGTPGRGGPNGRAIAVCQLIEVSTTELVAPATDARTEHGMEGRIPECHQRLDCGLHDATG